MSAARFSASFPAPAAPPLAQEAPLTAGERLGVWRVSQGLHACDTGRWYRVQHQLAAAEPALMLVAYRQGRDAMAMLLRVAEQAGLQEAFRHPVIKTPLDSGLTPAGQPYLVLPWMAQGQALVSAAALLPLRQRLALLLPLCAALAQAHEQGLLLRELDPGLLWLDANLQPRLMGLGLAELAPDPDAPPAPFSPPALAFVAPELRDGGPASLASEAYALGMLACWLVNHGRAPRPDANGVRRPSESSLAGLGAAERISLEALLLKALAEHPAQRHASARELGEDVQAWLDGRNHSALHLAPMPEPSPPPRTVAVPAELAGPQPPPARRKAWRRLLVLTALLALGGWMGQQAL